MEHNLNKKSLVLIITFIMLTLFSTVFGTQNSTDNAGNENHYGTFDIELSEDIIKTSDRNNSYLPYIYFSNQRIVADKPEERMGMLISESSIEIEAKQSELIGLISNDSIRINEQVEMPIIFANGNVIIAKNISKSAILISNAKIVIEKDAVINKDIICIADTLQIEGTVKGSVLGICNNVEVNGSIERDLRVHSDNVTIKDENCIKNNVYVKTSNKDLKLNTKSENTIINVTETDSNQINYGSLILDVVINSLVFVLVYILFGKKITEKLKVNDIFDFNKKTLNIILFGTLMLMLIPFVIFVLLLVSAIGIHQIAIPIMILYVAFLFAVGMLSTFIVGTVLYMYMKEQYLNKLENKYEKITLFFTYFSVGILANLPTIGYYITLILLILAYGIVILSFKKQK